MTIERRNPPVKAAAGAGLRESLDGALEEAVEHGFITRDFDYSQYDVPSVSIHEQNRHHGGFGGPAVNSPTATTLHNNKKITLQARLENEFAGRGAGGQDGSGMA